MGKAVVKHKAKLQEKVQTLFSTIEEAEKQEEHERVVRVDQRKARGCCSAVGNEIAIPAQGQPLKKAVRSLRKDLLPRLQKYETQQETLGDRNSYSKTDPDATFMRMKEDHMRNGQLKPGYNVQIGTENRRLQSSPTPDGTRCLKPHLEKVKAALGKLPKTVVADAGYGGEENYAYLEREELEALVKYSTYHKEKSKKWQQDISKLDNWQYDEAEDIWTCAAGRKLRFRYESKETTESGYEIPK